MGLIIEPMKVNLEFDLPTEKEDLDNALNGSKYKSVIRDIDNNIRLKLKHEELSDEEHIIYTEIRDKISYLLEDWNITI